MTRNERRDGGVLLIALAALISSCSHKATPPVTTVSIKPDSVVQSVPVASKPLPVDSVSVLTTHTPDVEAFWRAEIATKTAGLYKARKYESIWFLDKGPSDLFVAAQQMLQEASIEGLDPATYFDPAFAQRVEEAYKQPDNKRLLVDMDIAFTDRLLLFTTHVSEGRVMSVANGKSIWKRNAVTTSTNDVRLLSKIHTAQELNEALLRIEPQHQQYARLKQALASYRALEQYDSQPISVPSSVKPGERSPAIPQIRTKVLYLNMKQPPMARVPSKSAGHIDSTNLLSAGDVACGDSLLYDSALVAEVKQFQRRHGLTSDGVIGERTLRFMNQKISDRIAQIAVNMDRLRWMPAITSESYLLVNIPDYKLTVYEGDVRALEMRVIVGSSSTPTPVFDDRLNHIVFSPTWTVPVSIIKNEIIPNLRKDSTYYSEKNFVIYKQDVQIDPALEDWNDPNINPYQLRVVQNPGSDNSLGSVKFMMPNNMSVYLHDTPSRRLFNRDYRALSHGCVRLGEPAKLAAYLLKDQQGWDGERISKAMSGSSPATILLKKRYPVYLMYQTAWVDDEGQLQFREDIYGHDKIQAKQIQAARPGSLTAVAVSAAGM